MSLYKVRYLTSTGVERVMYVDAASDCDAERYLMSRHSDVSCIGVEFIVDDGDGI